MLLLLAKFFRGEPLVFGVLRLCWTDFSAFVTLND